MSGKETDTIARLRGALAGAQLIDLSYVLEEGMPAWPTQARYGAVVYESYDWGDAAVHAQVVLSEHTGTHIDAPRHFIPGAASVDALPLDGIMGRAAVLQAEDLAPCATLSLARVQAFEQQHGALEAGDIVLLRTGWDAYYDTQPRCAQFLRDWPGLSAEAARYLLQKGVAAVGTDALSLDSFSDAENPCHRILLGAGIPILENVCNVKQLPPYCFVMGLPLKFKGGSGSPIRLVAFVEKQDKED